MHRSGTGVRRGSGVMRDDSLCRREDAVITGLMSRVAAPLLSVALAAFASLAFTPGAQAGPHDALIAKHAAANGVPEHLIRRVIKIESRGNASAVHAGNYGLMQIRLGTARGLGYSGDAQGLLDADTNMTYAVKYLAGAYRAAGCDADRAVHYYQRGYYGAALRECAESPRALPLTQIAQEDPKLAAKVKRDAAAAKLDATPGKPADVIKPKVVRTETIISPQSGATAAQPVGNFEPKRVAPSWPPAPAVQPVVMAKPEPIAPKVEPKPVEPKVAAPAPVAPASLASASAVPSIIAPEPAPKFQLASVPMPPTRPEFDPLPKRETKPARRTARLHESANKKPIAEVIARPPWQSKPDPVGAVSSFVKKILTPDNNARRSTVEAEADPPSHIQPPQ